MIEARKKAYQRVFILADELPFFQENEDAVDIGLKGHASRNLSEGPQPVYTDLCMDRDSSLRSQFLCSAFRDICEAKPCSEALSELASLLSREKFELSQAAQK